jgi:3-oxoacyl-[acyl-carrier protein] reductase
VVAPGFIETDMTAAVDATVVQEFLERVPLRRAGKPEEVALAVDFLVGPGGAYVTGQTLVVDGGASI